MNPEQYQGIEKDWAFTANRFSSAVQEVALELGGTEFADSVTELAGDDWWPSAAALEKMEESFPGSVVSALDRMEATQKEDHAREIRREDVEAQKRLRDARRAGFISGFKSLFSPATPYFFHHEKRQ